MGPHVPDPVPCAKGAICYCLDVFSQGPGARARIANLRKALAAKAPDYRDLAEVFDEYLVRFVVKKMSARERIMEHLRAYWFDSDSPTNFFPGTPVAKIYALGVLEALDLSLKSKGRAVPLNAWWILDSTKFSLLSLADVKNRKTVGGNVTLLILTPRPKAKGKPVEPHIWGDVAEAYVTERLGGVVATKRVRDMV